MQPQARETRTRQPLERIWSQHVTLHRAVRALHQWIATASEADPQGPDPSDSGVAAVLALLHEIEQILPEHFAVEEAGGYFADVLSVAPDLADWAAELQSHHARLMEQLGQVLTAFSDATREPRDLATVLRSFVELLDEHEQGESELVRSAFRGAP